MVIRTNHIVFAFLFVCLFHRFFTTLALPHPEDVVLDVTGRVNASLTRSGFVKPDRYVSCLTGNPVDDCWRCNPKWEADRQRLADCGIGFGRNALGGKGGKTYVVTDHSDSGKPGSLRYAVGRQEPLWIIFSGDMTIELERILKVESFKTIDGRGASVVVTGRGCIEVKEVKHVIIHNIEVRDCHEGPSDGDGIAVRGSRHVWVDHCRLSKCGDGLLDVTRGSTAVTISNNHFSHHDKVMLLGRRDEDTMDEAMQVTVAFNRFGEGLMQRMPRCRRGFFHVVNNDYTGWGIYAVGGSAKPTITSQGNRFAAPDSDQKKQVTKRLDSNEEEWSHWNWRTDGDILANGAIFVASGDGVGLKSTAEATFSATFIDQITGNAGVLTPTLIKNTITVGGAPHGGGGGGGGDGGGGRGDGGDDGGNGGWNIVGNGTQGLQPPSFMSIFLFTLLLHRQLRCCANLI